MAEGIPPEFDRPWSKSDVVLRTLNSGDKDLHANKTVLSIFSPYFDALFSGRFAEKDLTSVDMKCDYNAMKEVLRNIHQIDCSYKSNGQKNFDAEMLMHLYTIGDFYNFPHIRKLCLDQMTDRPSVEMAVSASKLNLRDNVMAILMQLPVEEVQRFLGTNNTPYLFTKRETLRLFEKITGKALPRGSESSKQLLNLEEITSEIQTPRIDLTKPWKMADVVISTKNSMGRLLFSNITIINTVSNNFKNLKSLDVANEGSISSLITVDAEYVTMKEILSVIHHCNINYKDPERKLHPALLHSMYRVAVDLDIEMIRNFCEGYMLTVKKWRDFIYREDGHLSYRKGNDVVAVTPSQNTPSLSIIIMSGDIPPDFEKQWDMADIALHTEDSDGKKLYANKSVLAVFSPYFRALFFHDFKEKNDGTASLKCKFYPMKEILRIIHHIDFDYSSKGLKQYEAPMLVDLYRVADIYDFPAVRKLCLDQINERPSLEMAKVTMDLDLHDLLMDILEKLSRDQVREFVDIENTTHMFSKKDIRFFINKLTLFFPPEIEKKAFLVPPRLSTLASDIKNPQFDLTMPWKKSDVVILTKSSCLRILFGNLESIDVVSHSFRAIVTPIDHAYLKNKMYITNIDERIKYMAEVDFEYATMMEILSVIHHCNMDYLTERTLNPLLIYDMYRAADVDQLNIPMIRKMCTDALKKQSTVDAWEVTCRLFGVNLESPIYKSLTPKQRHQWICRKENHLSFDSYSGVVAITPAETDPLCSLRIVKSLLPE